MANSHRQLFKILIGVAWIDGQVSAAEQRHLQVVAAQLGLTDDPEINNLLTNVAQVPVAPADCYQWIEDFLGVQPSVDHYQELIDALSGLVYSDDDVATAEAQLLMTLQDVDPQQPHPPRSAPQKLLSRFRSAYRRWVDS
jgi:uncharacterized tellurite resistance protein B-like protein